MSDTETTSEPGSTPVELPVESPVLIDQELVRPALSERDQARSDKAAAIEAQRASEVLTDAGRAELRLKLDQLESEYTGLKRRVESQALAKQVDGEDLARKGDVSRQITAIKRKLGID